MNKLISIISSTVLFSLMAKAQDGISRADSIAGKKWTIHFQLTVISQDHSGFRALYSGMNSLADTVEPIASSITSTLFLGRRLWKGAAFYFNPEVSGGNGLSYTTGVAGALNGETYRVGAVSPRIFLARAYLQQMIPLGSTGYEDQDDNLNQIACKIPSNRLTISAGKFSMSDFYDDNKYSHDPRTQFINWALMSNGAWDYPANTRGYTEGVVVEWIKPKWAIRISSVAVPVKANMPEMEYVINKAHSETFELERKIKLNNRPGSFRFLISNTYSKAPSYKEGLEALASNNQFVLDEFRGITENPGYGGKKFGLGYSFDQELTNDIGIFSRAGWNDGKYATWAFTEIDHTFSFGISVKGTKWKRPDDILGIATVMNGISEDHRAFLKAGGYGFIIGDGNLNYGQETIAEFFYNAKVWKYFWLSFDYQFVNNPAYNKDRGPVDVFGLRGHIEL